MMGTSREERFARRVAGVLMLSLVTFQCGRFLPADFSGTLCNPDGSCGDGYVCDPGSLRCVRTGTLQTSDAGDTTGVYFFGENLSANFRSVAVDTYVDEATPTTNLGRDQALSVDQSDDAGSYRAALIRFDLTAMPSFKVLSGASLHIWTTSAASSVSSGTVSVYPVLEQWRADQATFQERLPGVSWTDAGVGLGSRGVSSVGSFRPTDSGLEYIVPLSPYLVSAWLADAGSNFGIVLINSNTDKAEFHSSDAVDVGLRPMLEVSVTH